MRFQGDNWAKSFYSPSWIIFPMIPSFSRKKHLKAIFKLKHLSYPQQWRTRIIPASASRSRGPVTRSSWHRSPLSRSTRRTWHAMPGFAAGVGFIDQKHVGGLIHPGRLTAGTYSHHPFRKENDLNQTFMRTCSMLIFRGVHRRTCFLLVVSVGWGYLILGVDMASECSDI